MKQTFSLLVVWLLLASTHPSTAKEFQLKDHSDVKKRFQVKAAGTAQEGEVPEEAKALQEPSRSEILQVVKAHVEKEMAGSNALFEIMDNELAQKRQLQLVEFNQQVGKMPDSMYYASVDFKDAATGELVIVDFDVAGHSGRAKVLSSQIYQVNGKARYIYGTQGKRMYFEVSR